MRARPSISLSPALHASSGSALIVLFLAFAVSVVNAGCGDQGCNQDVDCKGDRICVRGLCGDPPARLDGGSPSLDSAVVDLAVDSGPCTRAGVPATSEWPNGYVVNYNVQAPCENHRSCMECLPGATGQSQCQWCGAPSGKGTCVALNAACPEGAIGLANHYNGYCPELCDQMDGTTCASCVNQPGSNGACSWCPETRNCFNERATEVGLQPIAFCARTKAGAAGLACSDVLPACGP